MPKASEIIFANATTPGEQFALGSKVIKIPNQAQMDEALANPDVGFTLYLSFNMNENVTKAINESIKLEENLLTQIEKNDSIRNRLRTETAKIDSKTQKQLEKSFLNIEKLFKKNESLNEQLTTLADQAQNLTAKFDDEWHAYRSRYIDEIIRALEEAGIPLKEKQKQELRDQDTIEKIELKFNEFKIPLPIKKEAILNSAVNRIYLPASYDTYDSLAMDHQNNSPEVVAAIFKDKKVKTVLEKGEKDGGELANSQQETVNAWKDKYQTIVQQQTALREKMQAEQTVINEMQIEIERAVSEQRIQSIIEPPKPPKLG